VRSRIVLSIGVVMVVLGVALLVNGFVLRRPHITSSRALDAAFAVFFILRGAMNVRRARRRPAGAAPHPSSSQS
jgi:hypothetical protein